MASIFFLPSSSTCQHYDSSSLIANSDYIQKFDADKFTFSIEFFFFYDVVEYRSDPSFALDACGISMVDLKVSQSIVIDI
jgi:hypothetical protein